MDRIVVAWQLSLHTEVMDLSLPLHGVAPTLDAEVLTVLSGTTAPLTGRRVSNWLPGVAVRASSAY